MDEWLTADKIPFGRFMKYLVDWTLETAGPGIDAVSEAVKATIEASAAGLQAVPATVSIVVVAVLVYALHRRIALALAVAGALALIANLGFWQETMETVALVVTATVVSVAIGVPLGIAAGHRPWLDTALRPVLDLMQTLPTFVYLIPTLVLFGLGVVPGLVSTVIFALPAPIRLTQLGIAQVPPSLVEAARAFGATRWQVLTKIELPHALPTILAGVNQCILLSLSMVVIAALVGAGGLGAPVVRALNTVNIGLGFEAGAAIVLLAIVLARVVQPPKPRRKP
jgi:glycine betaine/proline transport system permease protein